MAMNDMPSVMQLVQRLWSEHKYALIARAPDEARDLGRRLAADGSNAGAALATMEAIMARPEAHLADAVAEAWAHLLPRVGMGARKVVETLLARDPDAARWLIAELAESSGDGVVAASRLLDHPAAVRRIWLRDRLGPTMYELRDDAPVRLPPAEIGHLLVQAFGDVAWRILGRIAERPQPVAKIREAFGDEGAKVLDAGHRLLVLRRVGGYYRSRGTVVPLILAGLGR
jgi:hypothetical protein